MSLQAAHSFIKRVREQDPVLRGRIEGLGLNATLEDLVQIGAEAGLDFTAEELQTAYGHNWAMLWFLHQTRADEA